MSNITIEITDENLAIVSQLQLGEDDQKKIMRFELQKRIAKLQAEIDDLTGQLESM